MIHGTYGPLGTTKEEISWPSLLVGTVEEFVYVRFVPGFSRPVMCVLEPSANPVFSELVRCEGVSDNDTSMFCTMEYSSVTRYTNCT
jgi:hypothetical protein